MLAQNKVDLIVSGDYTVKHLINKKQIDGALIERVNIEILKFDLYIALSKNIPANEVLKWQNALDQLKISGKYNEILKKYTTDSVN